jgi:hypothetical protein
MIAMTFSRLAPFEQGIAQARIPDPAAHAVKQQRRDAHHTIG